VQLIIPRFWNECCTLWGGVCNRKLQCVWPTWCLLHTPAYACLNLIWNAMTEYQEEGLFSSFIASEYHTCGWRSLSTCLWLLLLFKLHFGFVLFFSSLKACVSSFTCLLICYQVWKIHNLIVLIIIPKYGELFSTYLFLIWLWDCRI